MRGIALPRRGAPMEVGPQLASELANLTQLDLEGLRAVWSSRYGPPPRLRSVDLLRRLLAWRLQADAFGDLDIETRRELQRPTVVARQQRLKLGAKLAREWKGVRHEVEVTQEGVLFDGRTYVSLSEVARAITGVRWNGPRFFGLRDAA